MLLDKHNNIIPVPHKPTTRQLQAIRRKAKREVFGLPSYKRAPRGFFSLEARARHLLFDERRASSIQTS
jgi:hypothetical protein